MNAIAKKNAVNWFELFTSDFNRARRFYEATLQTKLQDAQMEGGQMGIFEFDNMNGIGGSITKMDGCNPGPGGTIVYLNVEGDLDGVLRRAEQNGGSVIKPRMSIGEHGFIGIIKDTEGNIVGLHSMT